MGVNASSPISFMNWTLHVLASYSNYSSMAMIVLIYILPTFPRNLTTETGKKENIIFQQITAVQ